MGVSAGVDKTPAGDAGSEGLAAGTVSLLFCDVHPESKNENNNIGVAILAMQFSFTGQRAKQGTHRQNGAKLVARKEVFQKAATIPGLSRDTDVQRENRKSRHRHSLHNHTRGLKSQRSDSGRPLKYVERNPFRVGSVPPIGSPDDNGAQGAFIDEVCFCEFPSLLLPDLAQTFLKPGTPRPTHAMRL